MSKQEGNECDGVCGILTDVAPVCNLGHRMSRQLSLTRLPDPGVAQDDGSKVHVERHEGMQNHCSNTCRPDELNQE